MFESFIHFIRSVYIIILLIRYNILPYSYWLSNRSIRNEAHGKRISMLLQRLGPTFIKFGQTVSSRVDIVGPEIANDLLELCDKLPPFSYDIVVKTIEKEFKCRLGDLFCEISKDPVSAASVAQVHRAVTQEGEVKAVKVLRPKIEKTFARDIKMLFWVAKIYTKFGKHSQRFQPLSLVETLARICKFELDLRFEAAHAEELRENTKNDPGCYVPTVDWIRTSKKVLTLEWIHGTPIYETNKLINREEIAKNLVFCFCNQVYRDCFFHGDMHPGNLIVDKNNNIVMVDFGIMGRIDKTTCSYITEILLGFLRRDYAHVAKIHFQAGYIDKMYKDEFITACRAIGEPIVQQKMQKISAADLLGQLLKITSDFEMKVQPHLLILQKTMVLIEGTCRRLSPEINTWDLAKLWTEQHQCKYKKEKYIEQIKNLHLVRVIYETPFFLKKLSNTLDIIKSNQIHESKNNKYFIIIVVILVLQTLLGIIK